MAWGKCVQCQLVQYWKSGRRPNIAKWSCSQCGGRLNDAAEPEYAAGDRHRILPSHGVCPRATEKWLYVSYQENEDWKRRMKGDVELFETRLLASGWTKAERAYHYSPPEGQGVFSLAEALREVEKRGSGATVPSR